MVGKAFTSREQDRVDLAFVRFLVESPTMLPLALGNNPLLQDLFDALSRREPGEIVLPKGYKTRSMIRRIATQFRDYVTTQLTEMHAFHHHLPFVEGSHDGWTPSATLKRTSMMTVTIKLMMVMTLKPTKLLLISSKS